MASFRPPARPDRRMVITGAVMAGAALGTGPVAAGTTTTFLLITYDSAAGGAPVTLEVIVRGAGPLVVLVPSLGRGARDFDDLAGRIAEAGFMAAAINPRGVGRSTGPDPRSLADCGQDVAEVVRQLSPTSPVAIVGHAFGNRVARSTAALHPDRVSCLILLAAGGQSPPAPGALRALHDVFDTTLPPQAHLAAVRAAFFAPGNAPEVWRDGWYPAVSRAQEMALRATPPDSWTGAGSAPILIVQAADDVIAPPANAEALRQAYPDRVTVRILPHAGHAMLPEQPELIATLVVARLRSRRA